MSRCSVADLIIKLAVLLVSYCTVVSELKLNKSLQTIYYCAGYLLPHNLLPHKVRLDSNIHCILASEPLLAEYINLPGRLFQVVSYGPNTH